MSRRYFRRYYEAADDSGAEPVEEAPVEETDDAAEAPEEAPAAVSFTPEDDLADLGSRYQRFAENHDDPRTARVEYGKHVDHLQSAFGRLSQGGEWTEQDIASAEALGFDVPDQEAEPEAVEPLWGAPWAEPTTMDEFWAIANERPWDALKFADANPGKINDDTRQKVVNYWAEHDRAGAIAYETGLARQQALDDAKAYADQLREEIRAEFGDVRAKHESDHNQMLMSNASALAARARAEVPDFEEHQDGVMQLLQERANIDPTYPGRLFALPLDMQLQEISDLTGAAAWRARPLLAAEAAAEVEAAKTAKITSDSARGRGAAGSPGTTSAQSAMKQKFTDDIRKALESPA